MDETLGQRSPMYMTLDSRLLGLAVTIFVLILTLKSDLLSITIITTQLVLSIPFFVASMLSNAKITSKETLHKFYLFNRATTAIASALLFNTLGLIISQYVSHIIGLIFFTVLLVILAVLVIMDYSETKVSTEGISFVFVVIFGLLPALGIF